MNPAPFLLLGGALAWLTLYLLGGRKVKAGEFILGAIIFPLSITLQNIVQQLPLLWVGIRPDITSLGTSEIIAISIWMGLIAGIFQELFKYIFVRGKSAGYAFSVGLGFAISEVIFITALVTLSAKGGTPSQPFATNLLSLAERYLVVLFHVGTAIMLTQGTRKVLIEVIGLHALIDSMAAYYQLMSAVYIKTNKIYMIPRILLLTEIVLAVITVIVLIASLPKISQVKEEKEEVIW
ncbi:YhfC family intramembrane metalloprotease [Pyrococcus furiosus DSM 3638]|uniref:YhfC family intramembrane metalloprotease n=3 Tax=Pyrococcus furiosus TaxID=2261 RepID=A0A5C0XRH0_PYRFU|nr:YhfC family glutamic-type intramembrane protease [Pyrococcus furiosus]AAL81881.1 hypothetical protein PF1757 [Pyrococcus furiosus DSM 3638]AFN04883.1 hypothetical protein PFC_09810 [Pyrococcus furiosus COM1]QEK79359.1 YhfC family intramembrane metalloprotease [Pyrococcus furiosus DSM 3638]